MRKWMLTMAAGALLAGTACSGGRETQAGPARTGGKTVRVLTVGNSFAVNSTRYLNDLASAAGHRAVIGPCNVGGASLENHWKKVEAYERDPAAAATNGSQYGQNKSLKDWLLAEKWDVVTIQQYSRISHDPATYQPYARELRDYIRKAAPQAEVVFLQTWAYRSDYAGFPQTPGPNPRTLDRDEMARRVKEAYETVGKELGVRGIPVGDAFNLIETDPQWRFKPDANYDFKSAKPGELPDQTHSLHRGYYWGKDKDGNEVRMMDGRHANAAGQYLGSCVLFEFLFGESVVGNPFVPAGIDAAFARRLQQAAHEAVAGQPAKAAAR